MGSFIEINDTLQLTRQQGFPAELNVKQHLKTPYKTEDFKDKIFSFHNKSDIRMYKVPPTRNFFVENKNGKWIYWGLVHILETTIDYVKRTTSGKFTIIYINNPEEMIKAHALIDRRLDKQYFT